LLICLTFLVGKELKSCKNNFGRLTKFAEIRLRLYDGPMFYGPSQEVEFDGCLQL
jgi:hypothetical protein